MSIYKVEVNSERDYSVVIGENWLTRTIELTANRGAVLLLIPEDFDREFEITKALSAKSNKFEIVHLPNGELQKSFKVYQSVLEICGRINLDRSDLIVGIGGGATTDLAGFVAATWLRGLDWLAIPTTLAGMVDAAVGGKTGINSEHGKNLIGAFHSPIEVIVDLAFLDTLSERDKNAGLAEVIKCGFIADPTILEDLAATEIDFAKLVTKSVSVKASVVSNDFKESFHREILNYGHTVGHAIELDSHFSLRHGEAVAIGMIFAAELSHSTGTLSSEAVKMHRDLIARFALPSSYSLKSWPSIYEHLLRDKKNRGKKVRFVTLKSIGVTDRFEVEDEAVLRKVYERIAL